MRLSAKPEDMQDDCLPPNQSNKLPRLTEAEWKRLREHAAAASLAAYRREHSDRL